jgi:predicted transcriptional regulator of viral defense system
MKRPKVEYQITEAVKLFQKGTVLFVDDFLDYGNPESVKKALLRLKEKNILVRLAHGIYLFPKIDKELGVLFPSTEDIAKAIARRDKARIVLTGVQALNKLGLSSQVPMKIVYLTDGAARTVKVGKRTIRFKKTSPKNLLTQGEISSLVIQALKTIGQKNIDNETIKKILNILKNEQQENIKNDAKLSPAWIHKILKQSIQ